jgi:uncharacterized protein
MIRLGLAVGALLAFWGCGPSESPAAKELPVDPPAQPTAGQGTGAQATTGTTVSVRHPNRLYQLADLETVEVRGGSGTFPSWIMDTPGKQAEGMMFLKDEDVEAEQGMLFVYDSVQSANQGFWMKNTYIPLDIVYVDASRRVVSIGQGQPLSTESIYPEGPWQYVLELKQGTAARHGIRPGTQLSW